MTDIMAKIVHDQFKHNYAIKWGNNNLQQLTVLVIINLDYWLMVAGPCSSSLA